MEVIRKTRESQKVDTEILGKLLELAFDPAFSMIEVLTGSFIEGGNIYSLIAAGDATNPPGGPHAWANWAPWNESPAFMRCPSDAGYTNSTRTNSYALSAGDQVEGLMNGLSGQARGVFSPRGSVRGYRFADISDGTSNTIALSERLCQQSTPYRATDPVTVAGRYFVAGSSIQARFGIAWQDANPMYVSFNTVFPPNGASCADGGINGDSVHLVIPAASRHTGGVNVALCDGSVRFISDSIDTGNLNARQAISGPSVYGAWGALGSKSGGEVSSVPDSSVQVQLENRITESAVIFVFYITKSSSSEGMSSSEGIKNVIWLLDTWVSRMFVFAGFEWMFGRKTRACLSSFGNDHSEREARGRCNRCIHTFNRRFWTTCVRHLGRDWCLQTYDSEQWGWSCRRKL